MVKTNKERLPIKPLLGKIKEMGNESFGNMVMDPNGRGLYRVGTGGIHYNYKLGESCRKLVGTHLQPGVSVVYGGGEPATNPFFGSPAMAAFNQYACVGNPVTILGGPLEGKTGVVTGKISGFGLSVAFADDVIAQMNGTERFVVRACGVGLEIEGDEDVAVHNLDPAIFDKMDITAHDGVYDVKVKAVIPGHMVGSGVGGGVTASCAQLMTDGDENDALYGLDKLCVGDFVAITDMDMTSGRTFWEGAVAICIVVSGDCESAGAGPGIMTVLACKTARIHPVVCDDANLAGLISL